MSEPIFAVIAEVVARYYAIEKASLYEKGRHKSQVVARHTAMYVARRVAEFSYPQIAEGFGREDHTTAWHACQKMELLAASDPGYARAVESMIQEVRGLGIRGGPVKIRPELLCLIEERVSLGVYGKNVEDIVDRILCEHFQRESRSR